ncbi:MAG: hypothetical protein JWR77_1527 [Rhizorhabdus sp.]|nr:hypothetical protein [Rhizorhabdus sp.]
MRSKIKLLLTRRDGVTNGQIEARLAGICTDLVARASDDLSFLRAYAVPDADLYQTAAGAFDAADRPFDTLMDIILDGPGPERLVPLFDGMAATLADLIDPARSAALAGTEHPILPGNGPLLVIIANRRLPRFTHDGFIRYWIDYHGPFAREHTPPEVGLGYRQFHTDVAATEALLAGSGFAIGDFDGAAECHYRDAEAVRMLMGMQEIVDEATEDEKGFVDHRRCVTSVLDVAFDGQGGVMA